MNRTRTARAAVLLVVVLLAGLYVGAGGMSRQTFAADAFAECAVQVSNDFAFKLYAQLAKNNLKENLFFSPYSLSTVLAMTAEGARGQTAMEMGEVLCLPEAARGKGGDAKDMPWKLGQIHNGFFKIDQYLNARKDVAADPTVLAEAAKVRKEFNALRAQVSRLRKDERWDEYAKAVVLARQTAEKLQKLLSTVNLYELRIANAIWGQRTYPFVDSYLSTIDRYYKTGGVFPADFETNYPAERVRINKWVEDKTAGRITDLIPDLPPAEARFIRLILTNAIYFKGEWFVQFDKAWTDNRGFHLAGGGTAKTPIMRLWDMDVGRYGAFNADGSLFATPVMIRRGQTTGLYPDDKGFAMAELPYDAGSLSMVILAPNAPDGLAALEQKLTAAKVSILVGRLRNRPFHVLLPKFRLETGYDMNETLQAMGMVRAFTPPTRPNGADLTGMRASKDPGKRFYIDKIMHKAFVEVNEKGTEAAAATGGGLFDGGDEPEATLFVPSFQADRPFLFFIRDIKSGLILFMGRMTDPTSAASAPPPAVAPATAPAPEA